MSGALAWWYIATEERTLERPQGCVVAVRTGETSVSATALHGQQHLCAVAFPGTGQGRIDGGVYGGWDGGLHGAKVGRDLGRETSKNVYPEKVSDLVAWKLMQRLLRR